MKLASDVWVAAAAASLLLLASSHARAQEVRLGGGMDVPLEPSEFTDLYNVGFHGGAELSFSTNKTRSVHLGIAAYHHRFPLDQQGALDAAGAPPGTSIDLSGGTYLITEVYALLRADLSKGKTRPFFVLGLGFAQQGATDLKSTVAGQTHTAEFDSEEDGMLTLGLGVSHDFGSVGLFGQVRMTTIFNEGDDTRFVPITIGVEL